MLKDTPSIAFAPSLLLFSVPSKSINVLSIEACEHTFLFISAGAIILLTLLTA